MTAACATFVGDREHGLGISTAAIGRSSGMAHAGDVPAKWDVAWGQTEKFESALEHSAIARLTMWWHPGCGV